MKNAKKLRRIFVSVLALALALLLILPLLSTLFISAGAAGEDELRDQIGDLQSSASDLKNAMKEVKDRLSALKNDKAKALERKRLLDQQMEAIETGIQNIEEQIALYDDLIAQTELQLAEDIAKEEQQYALFCERVRDMEETGSISYWSILFNASDFSDLLDRATFVSEVMEYDNAVMDMLADARAATEATKAELEQALAEQEAARAEQEAAKAELELVVQEAQALVAEMEKKENGYQEALDELEAEAREIDAAIIKKQKELEQKIRDGQISFDPGSGWQWPVPGYYTITSVFGPRIHPITGRPGNHTGTDVAAPKNTPILSARGGVVTLSTYGNSYGNYVVVQHDNGISTLYAHMNSRAVKEGDVVAQGAVLGYVGTTGSSTGYHLHFEVRVNGTRVDALDYYKELSFTYR